MNTALDVVLIGYNETPFENYLSTLRSYGEDAEAYRDLKTNFFEVEGNNYTYLDLLNKLSDMELKSCDIPNLAAVYLSHFLLKRGLQVDFINLFQEEKDKLRSLLEKNPVCVAITTTFYVINLPVTEMVRFIRSCNPHVPIIIGGVLVSNHYNAYGKEDFFSALRDMEGDIFVLESQGEQTLYNLVTRLKNQQDLNEVKNIIYRQENGEFTMTERVIENNSLDSEAIDWSLFKHHDLGSTLQTRTARSCAFGCAFCGYPERGGPLTLASIDTIAKELETMRALGNVKNVVFIDDTFNVPKARFKEFCRMLIDRQFDFNWFSYYRCDHGDEEALDLMAASGCKGVFLGIESGSQEMLEKMNKRAKVTNYEKGIKNLKERGIMTFASLITGYPGETEATIRETIDFIKGNKPDYWRTMLWYCDPLTPVYQKKKEEFRIKGEGFKWEHYSMTSMEAADYIHEIFLTINPDESIWLPQYSFDFWVIPYLLGKGFSFSSFKSFMHLAQQALALEIASVHPDMKTHRQQHLFDRIRKIFEPNVAEESKFLI